MIDFSKVRVGDKVLVEGTVTCKTSALGQDCPIGVIIPHQHMTVSCWPTSKAIVAHIPCIFKPGDKVHHPSFHPKTGHVVAVHAGEIWVRYNDGSSYIHESSQLSLIISAEEL